MTVFGYLRVSRATKADEEAAIEVQEKELQSYASSHKLHIDRWLRDRKVAGSIPFANRHNASTLLKEAKKGDVIITPRFECMFRKAKDAFTILKELREKGVSVHCIDLGGDICNGLGKIVLPVLSALGERENLHVRKRLSDAKRKMRSKDLYQGGKVPFGFKLTTEGRLAEDEEQQRCLKFARDEHREGLSYRTISQRLNEQFGIQLSHAAIQKILKGTRKTDRIRSKKPN